MSQKSGSKEKDAEKGGVGNSIAMKCPSRRKGFLGNPPASETFLCKPGNVLVGSTIPPTPWKRVGTFPIWEMKSSYRYRPKGISKNTSDPLLHIISWNNKQDHLYR